MYDYADLLQRAGIHRRPWSDLTPSEHRRLLRHMCDDLDAVVQALPTFGVEALRVARSHWTGGPSDATPMERYRIRCWEYLEDKNGSSIAIEDREDHAIRALLCVLYPEGPDDDNLDLAFAFYIEMMEAFSRLPE